MGGIVRRSVLIRKIESSGARVKLPSFVREQAGWAAFPPSLAPRGTLHERMRPAMKADVLDQIASSEPMAAKLGELRTGADVIFEHVVEAARPMLAAIVAREAKARVWIVCADVRSQEALQS